MHTTGDESLSLQRFLRRGHAVHSPPLTWWVFQPLGGALAYGAYRLRMTPAALTAASAISGLVGALLLARAETGTAALVSGALLLLSYAFDCSDGQLARATRSTSERGAWLDVCADGCVIIGLTSAVLLQVLPGLADPTPAFLVAVAFGASRVCALVTGTLVRKGGSGGLQVGGRWGAVRQIYVALMDTPTIYVLVAVGVVLEILAPVVLGLTVLTGLQILVAGRNAFAGPVRPSR